ncbi:MAG: carboxypeptidase-like regulatory domain-containing protein, partial [Acidobacteriota bacterium]|nr:carboxypeptidase-like regulatory domain-containing protein [Acidobacteriota bacterium]
VAVNMVTNKIYVPNAYSNDVAVINDDSNLSATIMIGGRVVSSSGRGLARARVAITDLNGITRYATTNAFGYYRFSNLQSGETYIVNVKSKGYSYAQQVLAVNQDIGNLNFTAQPVKLQSKMQFSPSSDF